MGLGLNLGIHVRVKGHAPSTLRADFECHLVGVVPIVSQAMRIPKVSDLVEASGFRNARALSILALRRG